VITPAARRNQVPAASHQPSASRQAKGRVFAAAAGGVQICSDATRRPTATSKYWSPQP
jgi:hypothetical protein